MSVKTNVGVVATALLLVAAYAVVQTARENADAKTATVTVTWAPRTRTSVVRVIVRVAAKDRLGLKTFDGGFFEETYAVKRPDQILVAVDPITSTVTNITCSIVVTGQSPKPPVSGLGHIVCLDAVT